MNYRFMLGIGLLTTAVMAFVANGNEASRRSRPVTNEEAASRLGGDSDMCSAPKGISCNTLCVLMGSQCYDCTGSMYTGCRAHVGTTCTPTYNPLLMMWCGVQFVGPPVGGACSAAECKTMSMTKCGLIPNSTNGNDCP